MKVRVYEHHSGGRARVFAGTEQELADDLLHAYPGLRRVEDKSLDSLLRVLSKMQAYSASLDRAPDRSGDIFLQDFRKSSAAHDQLGYDPEWERLLRAAAAFWGAGVEPPPTALRPGEDYAGEILRAYGVEDTAENRAGLRALAGLQKSERGVDVGDAVKVSEVLQLTAASSAFADVVRRAAAAGTLHEIRLGEGRHSQGTLQAVDPESDTVLLLKPGSGGLNPAAGEDQTAASPAKREAAFSDCAGVFGPACREAVPECRLLLVDGREYAAMVMLHDGYLNCNQLRDEQPGRARRSIALHFGHGDAHRWAAMDFVLGNSDRNAGNVMIRDFDVRLIDAGAAFAGSEFSPASDPAVFVPYYLRVLAAGDFDKLSAEDKFRALPRVSAAAADELAEWLRGVEGDSLAGALTTYAIAPGACIARLDRLRHYAEQMAADAAVNAAWTLG